MGYSNRDKETGDGNAQELERIIKEAIQLTALKELMSKKDNKVLIKAFDEEINNKGMAACQLNPPNFDKVTYVTPEKITGHEFHSLRDEENRKIKTVRFRAEISDLHPTHWDGWIFMEEFAYSIEATRLMIHYFNQTITNRTVREQLAKMIVGAKSKKISHKIQKSRARVHT